MKLIESRKGNKSELKLYKDNSNRWHWRLNRMGWEIARSRVEGYKSKSAATQSLIGVANAIKALR